MLSANSLVKLLRIGGMARANSLQGTRKIIYCLTFLSILNALNTSFNQPAGNSYERICES